MKVYKNREPWEPFVRLKDETLNESSKKTFCKWTEECNLTRVGNCNNCPAHGTTKELLKKVFFDEALQWWGDK